MMVDERIDTEYVLSGNISGNAVPKVIIDALIIVGNFPSIPTTLSKNNREDHDGNFRGQVYKYQQAEELYSG